MSKFADLWFHQTKYQNPILTCAGMSIFVAPNYGSVNLGYFSDISIVHKYIFFNGYGLALDGEFAWKFISAQVPISTHTILIP
ncbi:hypothetical protein J6590_076765 [Homalodisca vitripennis]|nr:hypothetical protein J6590_076765 [Homalodisca vitripennis]